MSKRRTHTSLTGLVTLALTLSTVSCLREPTDESTIATRSTPVSFSGVYPTTEGGTNPDYTFYVYAKDRTDGDSLRQIPGVSATTTGSGFDYGVYTWYGLTFGDVVVPTWAWAWDTGESKWYAELRVRTAPGVGLWLYTFTTDELSCFVEELGEDENVVTAATNCGGDDIVDLYADP